MSSAAMCVPLQLSEEMSLNYSSATAAKYFPLFQQTRLPSRIYGPFNSISGDGAALCDTGCIPDILINGTGLSKNQGDNQVCNSHIGNWHHSEHS